MKFDQFQKIASTRLRDDSHSADPDHFVIEWVTGGSSGGNCWDDTPSRRYFTNDPEPELILDPLFEQLCPTMTFSQHRKVMKVVLERSNRTEEGYYGNYVEYGIKKVNYRKLYEVLLSEGLITND